MLTFTGVYLEYVGRCLVPVELGLSDAVTRFDSLPSGRQALQLFGCLLLLGLQVFAATRWRWSARWIVLFNLALLPVAQLVPILHFKADRYLYLPSLAAVGLAVEGAARLGARFAAAAPGLVRVSLVAAALLAGGLGAARGAARVRLFADDVRLFSAEIRQVPDYREGLFHLARAHQRRGELEEALALYERCMEEDPSRVSWLQKEAVVVNYGQLLVELGRAADAYEFLQTYGPAIASPGLAQLARYNLAVAALYSQRPGEALPALEEYRALWPDLAQVHLHAGVAAWTLGREELAAEAFDDFFGRSGGAVELERLVVDHGRQLLEQKRAEEAYRFLAAFGTRVTDPELERRARHELAVAALYTERFEEALPVLERSRSRWPEEPAVHFHAGLCAWKLGRDELAREAFGRYLPLAVEAGGADPKHLRLAESVLLELGAP